MLKFVSKNALLLSIAAIGCVAVIAGVNQLTASRIAEQTQAEKLKVLVPRLLNINGANW